MKVLPLLSGHTGVVAAVGALDVDADCDEDDEDDEAIVEKLLEMTLSVEAEVCDDEVEIAGEDATAPVSATEEDEDIGVDMLPVESDMETLTELPEDDVFDVIAVESRVVGGELSPGVIEDTDVCVRYVQFATEDVGVLGPQEIGEETGYERFEDVEGEVCDDGIDVDDAAIEFEYEIEP